MKKAMVRIVLFLGVLSFLIPIKAEAALTNSGAFGFKASYASNGYYYNETAYPGHLTAFRNAFNQVNGVSGINIRQTSNISNANIRLRTSVAMETWWGLQSGGSSSSILWINDRTTARDNFTSSNFNWLGMHEVGHALGMHHQRPGIYSVMRTGSKISMNSLGVIDRDNLNWRY